MTLGFAWISFQVRMHRYAIEWQLLHLVNLNLDFFSIFVSAHITSDCPWPPTPPAWTNYRLNFQTSHSHPSTRHLIEFLPIQRSIILAYNLMYYKVDNVGYHVRSRFFTTKIDMMPKNQCTYGLKIHLNIKIQMHFNRVTKLNIWCH